VSSLIEIDQIFPAHMTAFHASRIFASAALRIRCPSPAPYGRRPDNGIWMMRGDMLHIKRGKVIPGTDVTHFSACRRKWVNGDRIVLEFQRGKSVVAPRAG
jgi:hypothetical protein